MKSKSVGLLFFSGSFNAVNLLRMKILIFGGSGFIGKYLISGMSNGPYEIVVFTRDPGKVDPGFKQKAKWIKWDGQAMEPVIRNCTGKYAIINLAGENIGGKLWTKNQKEKILSSRINITRNISLAINQSTEKPVVFIQGSATGFYGTQDEKRIDENFAKGTGFLAEVVDAWEKSLKLNDEELIRIVYIRTGIVLAIDGGILPLILQPFRFFLGGCPGNGKQWISWIHIKDVLKAIGFILENNNISGVFNLTSPEPVQMKIFCRIAGQSIGKPSWLNIPAFILKLLPGGMASELFLTSQKIFPDRLIEGGFEFGYKDVRTAMYDLLVKKN